ncbi:MAG TPA: hypothetical protein VEH29_16165 [Acidimicrobiales bacterium]|nr:hypothetical protein [Acidimicrobiales bacterium]
MLCNDGMADGAEAKAVYSSRDGGHSWELMAQSQAFALTHPVGRLEASGYADALVALSPTTVLMGVGYPLGGIELSTDAGRDWRIIRTNPEDIGSQTGGLVCVGSARCWTTSYDYVMRSVSLLRWEATAVG